MEMHRKQMAQVEDENLTACMVSMVANKRSWTTVLKCKINIVNILCVLCVSTTYQVRVVLQKLLKRKFLA